MHDGKGDREGASLTHLGLEGHRSSHGLDELQRQGKPETGPLHPALFGTETLERLEHPVPQLDGDPRPGVGHQDREVAVDP